MEKINFDVAFVLGSLPLKRPSGGDQIVFRITRELKKKGYKVCFIISNSSIRKELGINDNNDKQINYKMNIHEKLYDLLPKKIIKPFSKVIQHIYGKSYDFSIIENIPIFVLRKDKKYNLNIKNIFATWWGTAFFVNEIKLNCDNKYYLIQNKEDDPSFSGSLSSYARRSYDLPLKKVVINSSLLRRFQSDDPLFLHIGIDINYWKEVSQTKENIILFPLRNEYYKGSDVVLNALNNIKDELKNFKLIGFGNLNKKKVPKWIEYHENISDEFLKKLYGKSKIFILPSRTEGFPLVNLEAMVNGCALISTKFDGYDTYLIDGVNSVLVEIENVNELSNAILSLSQNSDMIAKISEEGKKTALYFSEDNMVSEFESIIKTNNMH
ncbi:glycosyltransferase family 4 protein [Caldiplasma sukawensis]